jgi:hypothetical protein
MTIAFGSLGAMVPLSSPLRFVLVALAGWVNRQQRDVIDYLQEENRALREQLGPGQSLPPRTSSPSTSGPVAA